MSLAFIVHRLLSAQKTMLICTNCYRPYPDDQTPYRCPVCSGLYDFDSLPEFDQTQVDASQPGIWRYRHALGLLAAAPAVTLGEGNTPLVWSEAFGQPVAFKLEFCNPTGSFKDRGTAPLISFLLARGVVAAVEDSSGNAGAAFAAYAAAAGLQARVFVPAYASGPKRAQIAAYGAEIVSVPGPRSNAAEAVQQAAAQGAVYASHAYLPQGILGYATIAYELFEQLGQAPGTVIAPTGQGGLLLGLGRGFAALQQAGLISVFPRLVGVQAAVCAPLWSASLYGPLGLQMIAEGETLAEGVCVRHPLRGDALLHLVGATKGQFVAVAEEKILSGRDQLAHRGLFVEPTSAIIWDGLAQVVGQVPKPIVAILTGSGLKSFQ
jgi:threonine synthase